MATLRSAISVRSFLLFSYRYRPTDHISRCNVIQAPSLRHYGLGRGTSRGSPRRRRRTPLFFSDGLSRRFSLPPNRLRDCFGARVMPSFPTRGVFRGTSAAGAATNDGLGRGLMPVMVFTSRPVTRARPDCIAETVFLSFNRTFSRIMAQLRSEEASFTRRSYLVGRHTRRLEKKKPVSFVVLWPFQ